MTSDSAAVYWLILATSLTSVITTLLYLFQKCCSNCWGNISSVCFQNFAAALELRDMPVSAKVFQEVLGVVKQWHIQSFEDVKVDGQLALEHDGAADPVARYCLQYCAKSEVRWGEVVSFVRGPSFAERLAAKLSKSTARQR